MGLNMMHPRRVIVIGAAVGVALFIPASALAVGSTSAPAGQPLVGSPDPSPSSPGLEASHKVAKATKPIAPGQFPDVGRAAAYAGGQPPALPVIRTVNATKRTVVTPKH